MNLTGIRPTGRLHLGHYFSVIKPALDDETCLVLIANYHAPDGDAANLEAHLLAKYPALDGRILLQETSFDMSAFAWMLNQCPIGRLERMTQYKSTPANKRTAHLLVYPVMMAVDCIGYDGVYVGDDQKQHLELATWLLEKYYAHINSIAKPPRPLLVGGRIMSLRKPYEKMSKSAPDGCIFLDDTPDDIRRKLRKADTTTAGINNLCILARRFGITFDAFNCEASKDNLADVIIRRLYGLTTE